MIDFIQSYLTGLGFVVTHAPDPTGQKAGLFASLGHRHLVTGTQLG